MKPLPRAKIGKPGTVSPDAWNRVIDELEAMKKRVAALTPHASPDITHKHSQNGFTSHLTRRRSGGGGNPIRPLVILGSRPAYIEAPASPVTPPAKRYFIEWGTINEIVATNWDAHFDLSATRYFFAEITFVASDQLKVASWQILTGAASNTHVTPDWDVGDPRPAKMVILLGVVSVIGSTHTISQSGAGSISVGEQITTINQGGAGETLIGKQLVYQRQNHE